MSAVRSGPAPPRPASGGRTGTVRAARRHGYGPGGRRRPVRGRAAAVRPRHAERRDGHIRHAAGRMPRGDGPVRRGGVGGGRRAGRAARPRVARRSARLRRRVPGAGSRRARARYAGRRCQSPVPPPRHREDGPSRIAVDCRRASTLIESPPGDRNGSARAAAGQHAEPSAPGCPLPGPGPGPGPGKRIARSSAGGYNPRSAPSAPFSARGARRTETGRAHAWTRTRIRVRGSAGGAAQTCPSVRPCPRAEPVRPASSGPVRDARPSGRGGRPRAARRAVRGRPCFSEAAR